MVIYSLGKEQARELKGYDAPVRNIPICKVSSDILKKDVGPENQEICR